MALPLALIPVALSAVRALLKYRRQLDRIFVDRETTAGLPFMIPPPPTAIGQHVPGMQMYFATQAGQDMLVLTGMKPIFDKPSKADADLKKLVRLYLEAEGLSLQRVGPVGDGSGMDIAPGRRSEAQLAYIMVSSARLSQNPTIARVVLATADTLLEFGAENASLFIDSPKTAGIVRTVVAEFAGERDLDDMSAEMLARHLIGAAVVTAVEYRDDLPEHPALGVLYTAFAELRREHGTNFANNIIARDGFQKVVQAYLTTASKDPALTEMLGKAATGRAVDDPLAIAATKSFGAMLEKLGSDLDDILEDPAAFAGVLEAGIAVAATHAGAVLEKEIEGKPLTVAVLTSVAEEIGQRAQSGTAGDTLFAELATQELWGSLFKIALASVAANADAISAQADVDDMVGKLIAVTAGVLSEDALQRIRDERGDAVLRQLLSRSLLVLAEDTEALVGDDPFANKVAGAVLEAAAPLVEDGLNSDDVVPLLDAAVKAATGNLALVEMDDKLRLVLISLTTALRADGIKPLLTNTGRRDALWAGLDAVAANPKLWAEIVDDNHVNLLQPLVSGLLHGLRTDPTNLLSGPALVEAFRLSLGALGQRGDSWIRQQNAGQELEALMSQALQRAQAELGRTIDGENLPTFLQRVILGFLAAMATGGAPSDPAAVIDAAVASLEAS